VNNSICWTPSAARNWKNSPGPRTTSATVLVSAKCNSAARFAAMKPGTTATIPNFTAKLRPNVLYSILLERSFMNAPPAPGVCSSPPPLHALGRVRQFWQRVSEGRQLDELWSQFTTDARASYGFYGKDVDWEEIQKLPRWHRPFHIAKDIFWAMLMKMTPARRVLLLLALVLLLVSGTAFTFQTGHTTVAFDLKFELFAALIFLLL